MGVVVVERPQPFLGIAVRLAEEVDSAVAIGEDQLASVLALAYFEHAVHQQAALRFANRMLVVADARVPEYEPTLAIRDEHMMFLHRPSAVAA
jgi:hypothetical protein